MGIGLITFFSAIPIVFRLEPSIVYFAPDVGTEQCVQGLIDGLSASGFEEGENLEIRARTLKGK